ncbi:MAG: hypothetical protein L0241_14155 [Planctomycetia bacterium]|nr:hypothetical protein [Planctomycetia bacterium]
MPIIPVTLLAPALNGAPLPPILQASVPPVGPGLSVWFVLVDEANGVATDPPLLATPNLVSGLWEATAAGHPIVIVQHFYTVVVIAVRIDSATLTVVDSGADARIKCRWL